MKQEFSLQICLRIFHETDEKEKQLSSVMEKADNDILFMFGNRKKI